MDPSVKLLPKCMKTRMSVIAKTLQVGTKQIESIPNENNKERVRRILHHLVHLKAITFTLDSDFATKNSTRSSHFRNVGNRFFSSKQELYLEKALQEYTRSVAYAPLGSTELALAYANRSAVLYSAKLISDCLLDIQQALENQYPDHLKSKLYLRKIMCLNALNPRDYSEIKKTLFEARKWLEKTDANNRLLLEKALKEQENFKFTEKIPCYKWDFKAIPPELSGENSMIPGLSDAVEMKYSTEFGRHLVATRDIKPGETVAIQKPYVKVILMQMRYYVCWHCGKQTWASLPCKNCVEVVFCSKNCQQNASQEYHDIECHVLSAMIAFGVEDGFLMALRLAIMAGMETGNSLKTLKKYVETIDSENDPMKKGLTNNRLEPFQFASAYTLIAQPAGELYRETVFFIGSILIAHLLATKTDLFKEKLCGDFSDLKNNDDFIFLITFVKKIICQTGDNGFGASIPINKDSSVELLQAIVPALSFFNHSCNPMVIRNLYGDYMTSTAIRPISKGEQIFDSYGIYYFEKPKKERHNFLRKYHFTCYCEACFNDWPVSTLPSKSLRKHRACLKMIENGLKDICKRWKMLTDTIDDFVRDNNCLRDVSIDVAEITELIELCYYRLRKNSSEVLISARYLEAFLRLGQNRYIELKPVAPSNTLN